MRHPLIHKASRGLLPLALVTILVMTGTPRAADPPPPVNPQQEIANALKPGQPADRRLAAVVLIGELAAAAKWDTTGALALNEYADTLAKLALDDPDRDVRVAALNAIGKLRPNLSVVLPTLKAVLHTHDKAHLPERVEAVKTIGALISREKPYDVVWLNPFQAFYGELVSAGTNKLTIKVGDQEQTFVVNKDTWITYQDEKDTSSKRINIPLDELNDKKNVLVRVAARGDREPLLAVRVEAYTARGQDSTWNYLEIFTWNAHDLIPLLGEALRDRDPAVRIPAANALYQFALRARDLASGTVTSHGKELADGRNLSKDRQDLKQVLTPFLQAIRDQAPVLEDMITAGDSAPENKILRRLACQTVEELATLRELLPRPTDRELLPRPAEPPPKEGGFQEQEESALRLAPVPEDKSSLEPIPDLAAILRALEKVLANRNDPDVDARLAAVQSLGMLGLDALPATPALVGALRDPNLFIRWTAARALGEIEAARRRAKAPPVKGAEGAVDGLLGLIYHPDPRVRVNLDPDAQISAILALGAFDLGSSTKNAEKAVYALGEVAASDDFSARLAALSTLRSLWIQGVKKRPSTRSLIQALFTQYPGFPQTQIAAADLLGQYGRAAEDAAPALREAVRDPDPAVRRAAGEALLRVMGPDRK